jgi:hypothetical protein
LRGQPTNAQKYWGRWLNSGHALRRQPTSAQKYWGRWLCQRARGDRNGDDKGGSGDEFLDSVVSRRDRGGSFSYGSELSLESFDTRRSLFCMARFHKSACMPLLDASLKDLNKLRILFCKVRFLTRMCPPGLVSPGCVSRCCSELSLESFDTHRALFIQSGSKLRLELFNSPSIPKFFGFVLLDLYCCIHQEPHKEHRIEQILSPEFIKAGLTICVQE